MAISSDERKRQELGRRLVEREVLCCVSGLVATIAHIEDSGSDLVASAQELCSPVLDYEEAALQAGWKRIGDHWRLDDAKYSDGYFEVYDAKAACEDSEVEPYEWEIYEHWVVTKWLAEKLQAEGERVELDFEGLCVWGRTCTGQAIALDDVVQRIALAVYGAEG